jgi:hypothetical protein
VAQFIIARSLVLAGSTTISRGGYYKRRLDWPDIARLKAEMADAHPHRGAAGVPNRPLLPGGLVPVIPKDGIYTPRFDISRYANLV